MTSERSERSKRRPEGHDEDLETDEKPETAKEVMNELRAEIENKPAEPEETEPPSEEPLWYPEPAEPCVRDASKELAWKEDLEREREEERDHECARQEREETAERDAFDDLEKELQKALEERGIDPEDLKEKWREQYVKDIEKYLNEQPEEQDKDSDEEDGEGKKPSVEGSSQHDAGSGQMYEMRTKPSVESDTEAEMEPQSESAEDTQEPEIGPESEAPKERVQPPSEKSEAGSEPEAVPSEHERPSAEDAVEEPEVENVPTEKPSSKTRSTEDTSIQEDITLEVPQETVKPEKECESTEPEEENETETPEIDVETKQETAPEVQVEAGETKQEVESETSEVEKQDTEQEEELETESQESESVEDLEDLAWKEQLLKIYNEMPEDWKEMFQEYLRGLVEDEEDLERLLKKHGLEALLEDDEQMEEVRKFLELKAALQEQGEEHLESIAEDLDIDMDQAEEWASGEVEPQILKDVLNLEAYWVFWELLRHNAEHGFPESVEELDSILQDNPMLELEDPTLPFELWKKDAKAWVEIMEMKRRGEIGIRLRNGREIYNREDIERLGNKYGIMKAEIIAWLRGEKVPPLIRRIGRRKLKKQNLEKVSFDTGGLIGTRESFEQVLSRNQDIRLDNRFDTWYRDVGIYFEVEERLAKGEGTLEELAQKYGISVWKLRNMRRNRPYLLNRLERSELRRIYAQVNGGSPEVDIESMEDLERLLEIHSDLQLENYDQCETYFEIRRLHAQGWTHTQLSKKFKMSRAQVNKWLNDYPPKPIPKLREAEEERLIQNWAQERVLRHRIEADNQDEQIRRLRGVILPNSDVDSLQELEDAVRYLASQVDSSSEKVLYADLSRDNEELFLSNRERLEELANEQLDLDGSSVHLAMVDGRLYIWVRNNQPFQLINLYGDLYFYFPDAQGYARLLEDVRVALRNARSQSLDETQRHLERVISQMFGSKVNLRDRKGRRIYRIRGEHLHLLLDMLGRQLRSLEGRISRLTGQTGYGGIRNPRFPWGERLASVLARLYATISCDGSIKESGEVRYWEEHLDRIERVAKNLRKLGDIEIKPKLEKNRLYCCTMPTIIGKILNAMGLQSGNKTRHNPRLSRAFLNAMSWDTSRDFTADTIPEDGSINIRKRAIECTHSVQLTSDIRQDEIDLIKGQGTKEESRWRLPFGKLKKLRDSTDPKIAEVANRLYKRVMNTPSNQIKDEKEIVEKLGVKLVDSPISVHYHGKSGNVTVSWRWRTAGEKEAMKLAIMVPPNDVRKREILKKWLQDNAEEAERVFKELQSQGLNVQRWWIE